jgi:hypothetical protein
MYYFNLKFSAFAEEEMKHKPTKFYFKILNSAEVMNVLQKNSKSSFNKVAEVLV